MQGYLPYTIRKPLPVCSSVCGHDIGSSLGSLSLITEPLSGVLAAEALSFMTAQPFSFDAFIICKLNAHLSLVD